MYAYAFEDVERRGYTRTRGVEKTKETKKEKRKKEKRKRERKMRLPFPVLLGAKNHLLEHATLDLSFKRCSSCKCTPLFCIYIYSRTYIRAYRAHLHNFTHARVHTHLAYHRTRIHARMFFTYVRVIPLYKLDHSTTSFTKESFIYALVSF